MAFYKRLFKQKSKEGKFDEAGLQSILGDIIKNENTILRRQITQEIEKLDVQDNLGELLDNSTATVELFTQFILILSMAQNRKRGLQLMAEITESKDESLESQKMEEIATEAMQLEQITKQCKANLINIICTSSVQRAPIITHMAAELEKEQEILGEEKSNPELVLIERADTLVQSELLNEEQDGVEKLQQDVDKFRAVISSMSHIENIHFLQVSPKQVEEAKKKKAALELQLQQLSKDKSKSDEIEFLQHNIKRFENGIEEAIQSKSEATQRMLDLIFDEDATEEIVKEVLGQNYKTLDLIQNKMKELMHAKIQNEVTQMAKSFQIETISQLQEFIDKKQSRRKKILEYLHNQAMQAIQKED